MPAPDWLKEEFEPKRRLFGSTTGGAAKVTTKAAAKTGEGVADPWGTFLASNGGKAFGEKAFGENGSPSSQASTIPPGASGAASSNG
jgi:hypothetical protein